MAFGDLKGTLQGSGTTLSATINDATGSVSVAVGDLVFINFTQQTSLNASGATDNLGNTYSAVSAGTDGGSISARAFYSRVTNAGTLTTITVAATSAALTWASIAGVIEGPFADPPLDANPSDITGDLTSPFTCPATGTLTQADESVIAWAAATTSPAVFAATSPNLLAGQLTVSASNRRAVLGYQTVAATSSVAPAFTSATNPDFSTVLGTASFKKAASGSTYTIDADAASYTYSATAAGLEFDRQVVADAASYAYTANAAALEFDRQIVADSASYAWTANDASLEYTPAGNTYTLSADGAAYLWTAQDAGLIYTPLNHYSLDADSAAYAWVANDTGLEWSGALQQQPVTYGGGHDDYEMRVRAYWDRIDALRRENRERDAAEVDRKRAIEARRQELAELEAERSRRSARKAQQARAATLQAIRDDIAGMERQSALLRAENEAVAAEIERLVAQAEQIAALSRRNALMLLMMTA